VSHKIQYLKIFFEVEQVTENRRVYKTELKKKLCGSRPPSEMKAKSLILKKFEVSLPPFGPVPVQLNLAQHLRQYSVTYFNIILHLRLCILEAIFLLRTINKICYVFHSFLIRAKSQLPS
jgi:hypothetical protein